MAFYAPDLSGMRPEYKVNVNIKTLFHTGQKIAFNNGTNPVFENSVVVSTVAPMPVQLILGTDYEINDDDIDYTSMSSILANDSSFPHRMLKSITIIRQGLSLSNPLKVNISFQQLYPMASLAGYLTNPGVVEFTPDVLVEMLSRLTTLESYIDGSGSSVAIPQSYPRLLPEDIHRTSSDNYVNNEIHNVNTFDGRRYIRPLTGSFFANVDAPNDPGIRVMKVDGNVLLDRDIAYVITGVDHHKTRITDDPSGVYTTIHIIEPYAGDIAVSYHAFGGVVTREDVERINDQVQDISSHISRPLLTEQQLPSTSAFINLVNRLMKMEDTMRAFATGSNYSDISSGTSQTHAIRTLDAGLHWWTIASLYKVDGSNNITTADRMKLRFALQGARLQGDVSIAFDQHNQQKLLVQSDSVINVLNYELYGPNDPTQPIAPQFRVIGDVSSIGDTPGVLLQIGLTLPAYQDILVVEDLSGRESCWKLTQRPNQNTQTLPQDNLVTLPSGNVVWDSVSPSAFAHTKMMAVEVPYRLWSGSLDLYQQTIPLIGSELPEGFIYTDIKSLDIHYTSGSERKMITIPVAVTGTTITGYGTIYGLNDATDVPIKVSINTITSHVELTRLIAIGGSSAGFDSLRYVLARV